MSEVIPKTLVVPLDGSPAAERSVAVAATIARRVGGGLLLVSATPDGPHEPEQYLAAIAARCSDVPIETLVRPDVLPVDAIMKTVGESVDRVACMTSHGRGRLRWSVLGSTTEEVIRRSDRPTLVVGRHCRDDFMTPQARMLTCVDGTEVSECIAPVALEWAERLGLETDAAVVISPLDVESIEHPETLLGPVVEHFGGPERVHAHLLRNAYVAAALADFGAELPAAMIAMSSHGRTGVSRVALGSVTMAVLNLAACPLLVTHCAG